MPFAKQVPIAAGRPKPIDADPELLKSLWSFFKIAPWNVVTTAVPSDVTIWSFSFKFLNNSSTK